MTQKDKMNQKYRGNARLRDFLNLVFVNFVEPLLQVLEIIECMKEDICDIKGQNKSRIGGKGQIEGLCEHSY